MDAGTIVRSKVGIVTAVLVIVCFAGIGGAYAYSSTLTVDHTVSADYLAINTYGDVYGGVNDYAIGSVAFDFDKPASEEIYAAGHLDFVPENKISVRVFSNGVESAYVYGWYTNSTSVFGGVAVESVVFHCNVTDSNGASVGSRDLVLVKDSYNNVGIGDGAVREVVLNSKTVGGETFYYYDMLVTGITVNYIGGLGFHGGTVDIHDGTNHGKVDLATATNILPFEYHFIAARTSLLDA